MALIVQNPSDTQGSLRVADVGPVPTDPGCNYTYALAYTGTELTTVDKSNQGLTWRKTLTWTGGQLTAVSAWVLQ